MTLNFKTADRRKLKNVNIFIDFDGTLQNATCSKIVEEILKYVLYQRHTIPVQFDGLNRELTMLQQKLIKEDNTEMDDTEEGKESPELKMSHTPEDFCKPKIYSTRDEIRKRKEEKIQRRRLGLLSRLVDSYRAVVKILKQEIESGDVSTVCLLLGNSIFSAKEAFLLYLPDDFEDHSNLTDRKAIVHLFRNLVMNEELLQLVSQPCQNQKLWIMLQKKKNKVLVSKEEESGLLPRPDYCFPTRTKTVHIWMTCNKIRRPEDTSSEMMLTPCADRLFPAGFSREEKMENAHESVEFTCSRHESRPPKRESVCRSNPEGDNEHKSDITEFKTPYKSAKCAFKSSTKPRRFTSVAGTPSATHSSYSLVETPNLSRIYSGSEAVATHSEVGGSHLFPGQGADEVPLANESSCRMPRSPLIYSPVKSLANTIDHFSISTGESHEEHMENSEHYMWFQVEDPILGFKNSRNCQPHC